MKKKRREPCYYCGAQATTKEHVPPKMMFRNFSCDRITVPSCVRHNSAKSGDDQAIVSVFIRPLHNELITDGLHHSLEVDVLKAIKTARSSFNRTKRKVVSNPLLSDPPKKLNNLPDVAHLTGDIRAWMRQLTAALVYDGTKAFDSTIKWDEAIAWSPDWVDSNKPSPLKTEHVVSKFRKGIATQAWLEQLDWWDGWSAYPKPYPSSIYFFRLSFEPEPQEIIFSHKFYNRYTWYVWFTASQETITKLRNKVALAKCGSSQ